MSALDKLLQRKKEMETESYERSSRGKVGRVGTRAGAADLHMIAYRSAKICEMLNGFVTFTQYFVTKLNLRNFFLHSAVKNL